MMDIFAIWGMALLMIILTTIAGMIIWLLVECIKATKNL